MYINTYVKRLVYQAALLHSNKIILKYNNKVNEYWCTYMCNNDQCTGDSNKDRMGEREREREEKSEW